MWLRDIQSCITLWLAVEEIDRIHVNQMSQEKYFVCNSPSGSHRLFPSSSNDVNLACSEEAATIKLVEGSNKMLEYARPRGIDLDGSVLSNWKSGIHSSRIGPLFPRERHCFKKKTKFYQPLQYTLRSRSSIPTTNKM